MKAENIFQAEIVEHREIAKNTYETVLRVKNPFQFKAGQYVWVVLPKLFYADKRGERRAFSLSSGDSHNGILTVSYRNSGSGFKRSLLKMKKGESLEIIGPLGSTLVLEDSDDANFVAVAGGSGITPFKALAEWLRDNPKVKKRLTIVHTDEDEASMPYFQEMQALAKNDRRIRYRPFFQKFEWAMLPKLLRIQRPKVFIVGGQGFINHANEMLLKHKYPSTRLRFENFYPLYNHEKLNELIHEFSSISMGTYAKHEGKLNELLVEAIINSTSHTIITDENGFVCYANEAAEKTTGFSLDEMRGNTPRLWGGQMDPKVYVDLWRTKKAGLPFQGEFYNRRKNGEVYAAFGHITPILTDERVIGYLAVEEDIESVKQGEREASYLASIVTNSDDAIYSRTLDGIIKTWNVGAEKLFGYTAKEVIGKNISMFFEKGSREIEKVNEIIAGGGLVDHLASTRTRKDGSIVEVIITASSIKSEPHKQKEIGVIVRDVTHELEVDKAKTEFVSLASHQLRTPLTSINWYAEMLAHGDGGDLSGPQLEFVNEIYRSSKRLVGLVNALLNASRIDLGTLGVDPHPVNIAEMSHGVVHELQQQISSKNLQFSEHYEEGLSLVQADPNLTRVIFENLISNAVKYTPANGKVSVDIAQKHAQEVQITVKDSGYGIPKSQQSQIFKKLFRADNVQKSDFEGTGLGLYVAKAIVEASSGKIWFESEENKGTSFYVVLPLDKIKKKKGSKGIISELE